MVKEMVDEGKNTVSAHEALLAKLKEEKKEITCDDFFSTLAILMTIIVPDKHYELIAAIETSAENMINKITEAVGATCEKLKTEVGDQLSLPTEEDDTTKE